jgi:hypothetical protein
MGGASDESGINPTSQPPLNGQKLSNESEDDMTLQKKLESICFRTVGQAEPWENLWSDVKVLARAFGQRNVISAFEIWAALQDDKVLKPIASFLKVAPFMLRNDGNAKLAEVTAEDVNNLVRRLVEVGRYEVLWSADQKVSLYKALQRYAADDVVSAFRTFYSNLTSEYDLRFASQTFIMHLPQLMQEVEKKKEQEEIMKKIERQSEIEAKQLLEKLKKEEEEEELFGADNLID